MSEANCTLLITTDKGVPPTQAELQKELEKPDAQTKIRALKTLVLLLLNGEKLPGLLMSVIRYCITVENHELKKLLYLYWEVVEKYDEQGKLLPQMILVCNALLGDLKHPNEFVRGCALRFLCRVREPEIVEPLIAAVKQNMEHRHSYVRRNAVMAVFTIWKSFGEDFFPDAAEMIEAFLVNETDVGVRRNAFLMLFHISSDRATNYFVEHIAEVSKFGDGFQLVILELTRKVCRADPMQKSRFIKIVFQLLQSDSHAVSYEAAWTLVSLSAAPTAIRAAAAAYTHLLTTDTDNNVKLVVLEKLIELKKHHSKVLQEILMDIMRALSSPNTDIRRRTLDIAMDLVSPRNIVELVQLLKKEIVKTQSKDMDRTVANEYRHMLIKAIHTCAVKYPSIAESVVHVLMDFLNGQGALDVVLFVREIVEAYPELRESVLTKLMDCLPEVKASHVYRVAVWILGEYASEDAAQAQAMDVLEECLGPVPFTRVKGQNVADAADAPIGDSDDVDEDAAPQVTKKVQLATKVTVLSDGTYATQTALTEVDDASKSEENKGPNLRKLILEGDYMLASVVIMAMTKMLLRSAKRHGRADPQVKEMSVKVLITCCALIQAGKLATSSLRIDSDSLDRMSMCMRVILDEKAASEITPLILNDCRAVFKDLLQSRKHEAEEEMLRLDGGKNKITSQADELITFRQLMPRHALGVSEIDLDDAGSLSRATGQEDNSNSSSKLLGAVHQLTGFSDPVYVEAQVSVHDYDIVLNILVINRTNQTLSNLAVELATVGDLKLVERPQSCSIGPLDYKHFKGSIKVSSTETGTIFGTITYDSSTSAKTTVINLSDIQIDIMDYIRPATCTDAQFRTMWAEFEWENKVAVYTQIDNCQDFLDHIVKSTNMKCLTPMFNLDTEFRDQCSFLAANLFARSLFGEDALVNVSVEAVNGTVEGYIRIRAKTQGIALSLGDRITLTQKGSKPNNSSSPNPAASP